MKAEFPMGILKKGIIKDEGYLFWERMVLRYSSRFLSRDLVISSFSKQVVREERFLGWSKELPSTLDIF